MRFDTKIAVVLRDDLATWQRVNVTAYLASALAAAAPEAIGQPYADADGTAYLAMFRQPVVVLAGDKEVLATVHGRALGRDMRIAIFTADLFHTGNDDDNRAAVRAVSGSDLDLVGIGVYGPRNAVDKVVKGAGMHP